MKNKIKRFRIFESKNIPIDNIKDYFTDLIDDGFEFQKLEKRYVKRTNEVSRFKSESHPFIGCTHIVYEVKLKLRSQDYKNYQEEFYSIVNRCSESEDLQIDSFTSQHRYLTNHAVALDPNHQNYFFFYLEVQFSSTFDEEVDENVQNMQIFPKKLSDMLEVRCSQTTFKISDIIIERDKDKFIIKTGPGINTLFKFNTLVNWIKDASGSRPLSNTFGSKLMVRKISGSGFFTFDFKIERPRFQDGRIIKPGIITITNIK